MTSAATELLAAFNIMQLPLRPGVDVEIEKGDRRRVICRMPAKAGGVSAENRARCLPRLLEIVTANEADIEHAVVAFVQRYGVLDFGSVPELPIAHRAALTGAVASPNHASVQLAEKTANYLRFARWLAALREVVQNLDAAPIASWANAIAYGDWQGPLDAPQKAQRSTDTTPMPANGPAWAVNVSYAIRTADRAGRLQTEPRRHQRLPKTSGELTDTANPTAKWWRGVVAEALINRLIAPVIVRVNLVYAFGAITARPALKDADDWYRGWEGAQEDFADGLHADPPSVPSPLYCLLALQFAELIAGSAGSNGNSPKKCSRDGCPNPIPYGALPNQDYCCRPECNRARNAQRVADHRAKQRPA